MMVRSKRIYSAIQYNKRGDHPAEYVWSDTMPILDEEEGVENKWPMTGRIGTLDECDPKNLQYAIMLNNPNNDYLTLELGEWIIEENGEVVGILSPERFKQDFEEFIPL